MTINDNIQHGIDDDPNNDAKKGAELGGLGGAVTGAVAGSAAGPVGTIVGAAVGAVAGAVASGAAVGAVDQVDNDNTISGIGSGVTPSIDNSLHQTGRALENDAINARREVSDSAYHTESNVERALGGNGLPGIQTGGHDVDGSPDTRGITEKMADAVTGDNIDDKTGKPVR